MKEDKKINWPLIAVIAFCVCVLIAAAALVLTQVIPSGSDKTDDVVVDKGPEEETDAPDEPTEEDTVRNAPAGALQALASYNPDTDTKYNLLLMGVDEGGSLTDVIMIYQIDLEAEKVNLLSIPRDSRITYNGRTEKINAVHAHGRQQADPQGGDRGDEYAIKFISELTGIPIHHYMCINTAAFRQIIDALGGFDYDVPKDMDYEDKWQDLYIHLKKGNQHLNGDKAEQLVRFRRYPNGDIDRVKTQQSVLKALVEQKVNVDYISKVPEIFRIINSNVSTDMTISEAVSLANDVLSASGSVNTYTAEGSFSEPGGVSYWVINNTKFKEQIHTIFGY